MRYYWGFLAFFLSFQSANAQPETEPANTRAEFQEKYEWRIQQVKLAGQYIPKDLFDAMNELDRRLEDSASRQKFKSMSEYDVEHKIFFSLGRWICTNWGLYEGSRIGHYLKEFGVTFPEDQAVFIMLAWHRRLNGKDLNVKQLQQYFVEKRRKEREERLKKAQVIEVIPKPKATPPKN